MASNFVITRWELAFITFKFLKGDSHICHFLVNGVPPQFITVMLVNSFFFLNWLGYLNTEFMSTYPIFGLYFCNYSIAFLQNIRYPPGKCWHGGYSWLNALLGELHRIWFFHIFKRDPSGAPVFPLYKHFPSSSGFLAPSYAVLGRYKYILLIDFFAVSMVIGNFIE